MLNVFKMADTALCGLLEEQRLWGNLMAVFGHRGAAPQAQKDQSNETCCHFCCSESHGALSVSQQFRLINSVRKISSWPARCVPAVLEKQINLMDQRMFSHNNCYMEKKKKKRGLLLRKKTLDSWFATFFSDYSFSWHKIKNISFS